MVVMSSDGVRLGTVKETRETNFLLDREAYFDLDIPYSDIKSIDENFITLDRKNDDLDKGAWDKVADTDVRPDPRDAPRPGDIKL